MAASVQFRPHNRDLGMVMREVDENLAIFLGMRNGEKEMNDYSDEFDDLTSTKQKPDSLSIEKALEAENAFLTSDAQDSDQSELANTCAESASAAVNQGPLSSGERKPTSRAVTPTGRRSLPAKSRPSRASSKPVAAQVRSCTPAKAASRSSTPTFRPTISKSASRPNTPTRKPATSSTTSASDGPLSGRKNQVPTQGSVNSRPSKTSEMPKRPASASRGRPNAPATTHLSLKPRQKSSSPAKVRAPNRSRGGGGDDVNPVLIGTKMVERVVNMRKLAPPKQDDRVSLDNPRKISQENLGFGRSLSKKSLDMAIRHMDIRRSSLLPVGSSVPIASSSDSSKSSNILSIDD